MSRLVISKERGKWEVCSWLFISADGQSRDSLRLKMLRAVLLLGVVQLAIGGDEYHRFRATGPAPEREQEPSFWAAEAVAGVRRRLRGLANERVADNVALFLGDGLSLPTLAAARAHRGQRAGRTGEEEQLAFEKFPITGLAKTYCTDAQVPDSACTATAYLCGAKANRGTIGVSARVRRRDCAAARDHHVASIAAWALSDGRDVGIVTTTRVTHASPAGAYAHTAERDWESDADVAAACAATAPAARQPDAALQLVTSYPGNQFKVILGGGRREFRPNTTIDEEGAAGRRWDGRDLIAEWRQQREAAKVSHSYAWSRAELLQATADPPEYLLGLFEASHMQYAAEARAAGNDEPTLAEMTEAAIRVLSRNPRGFFLFVEGGRIDQAHHDNYPRLALDETIELSDAVERASKLLSEENSLLVLTSDHAHVMAYNGYSHRGNDVLGPSDDIGDDGVPYMTLSYTNGPGYRPHVGEERVDVTKEDYNKLRYRAPALVPLEEETHGGEDVAVFARGPQQQLFTGLYEQSQLPHLMAHAACLPPLASLRPACLHRRPPFPHFPVPLEPLPENQ